MREVCCLFVMVEMVEMIILMSLLRSGNTSVPDILSVGAPMRRLLMFRVNSSVSMFSMCVLRPFIAIQPCTSLTVLLWSRMFLRCFVRASGCHFVPTRMADMH